VNILWQDQPDRAIVWNRYMRANYAVWQPGQECDVHSHRDAVELFVFLDGQCEMTVGDETAIVGAGQTVYVGPDVKHKLRAIGDQPLVMFLAVTPNHSPTHTIFRPDGSIIEHDRQPPGPGQIGYE